MDSPGSATIDRPWPAAPLGEPGEHVDPPGTRSTGRALAAAITALLISFLVASGSSRALHGESGNAANRFAPGDVALTDDDAETSMFDVDDLVPGRRVENCIAVAYEGSIRSAAISVGTRAIGELARHLEVELEIGDGGGFGDCSTFRPSGVVHRGSLADLAAAHPPGDHALGAFTAGREHPTRSFRFSVTLGAGPSPDDASAEADFVWQVSATDDAAERS